MEQVKHAIETGALRPASSCRHPPPGRELVINPNTVAKTYARARARRRHRAAPWRRRVRFRTCGGEEADRQAARGQAIVAAAVERLHARGITDEEIRRLFEAELAGLTRTGDQRG